MNMLSLVLFIIIPSPLTRVNTFDAGFLINNPTNWCTPKHCYYCDTNGNELWCTQCGNGMAISSQNGTNRTCNRPLTTSHCREPDPSEPDNPGKCGECMRGYYLQNNSCVKINLAGCAVPSILDDKPYCKGCEGTFILNSEEGCSSDDFHFPTHCLFGGIITEGECRVCSHGYEPAPNKTACLESRVVGCRVYHPRDPYKCSRCYEKEGYYAVNAFKGEDGIIEQICAYDSMMVKAFIHILVFLIVNLMKFAN